MDKKTIDTYNKLAKKYEKETIDFWLRFPDTIISEFAKNITKNKKVLDVGSGPGRDGLLLKNKGLNITCIDASHTMIQLCKVKGLKAVKGNLLQLPFKDKTFDGVWAYTSLLCIRKKEIEKALSEIRRVLKKDGIFGLGMIEGENELYRESSGIGEPRWFAFYSKEEIDELLNSNGFKITYFETFKPKTKNYLNYITKKISG